MNETDIRNALDEQEYTESQSQFHDSPMHVSIPCQLEFEYPININTPEELENAINNKTGYSCHIERAEKHEENLHFEAEVYTPNHSIIKLLIFRQNKIRIYPDEETTEDNFKDIFDLLEATLDVQLTHNPIN